MLVERLQASTQGWLLVPGGAGRILEVASELGTPAPARRGDPVVATLTARSHEEANRRSLSAVYGRGAFPFHTDCAHWPVPGRYVLLSSLEDESPIPTLLARWPTELADSDREVLLRSTFLVRNGRQSFYAGALNARRGFLRFDPGCMVPVNDDAHRAVALVRSATAGSVVYEHHWRKGDLLVLNNWVVLHSRPPVDSGHSRQLNRVLVRR